jgi:hypothetical protein
MKLLAGQVEPMTTTSSIPIILSVLALAVSVTSAWLTWFHRGSVRMTVPSMVVFGYDGRGDPSGLDPKVGAGIAKRVVVAAPTRDTRQVT